MSNKKGVRFGFKNQDKSIRRLLKEEKTTEAINVLNGLPKDYFAISTQDPLICVAAKKGNLEVVECLLGKGVMIEDNDHHGLTALHNAAKEGHVDVIELLLRNGADVQRTTTGGDSALYIAAKANQQQVVAKLVECGADVHHQSSFINNKDTVLHAAAVLPSSDILDIILQTNIDINRLNDDLRTALHLAALKGCHWNVKRLLKCGANPDILDSSGQTPLLLAADQDNVEVVRQLCIAGAALNVENNANQNALRKAVSHHHINVVRTLIHFGADVNRVFGDDETCLNFAISNCSHKMTKSWGGTGWNKKLRLSINVEVEMLDTLISAGADLNHVNSDGNSCLHVCVTHGCAAVLAYLINAGAHCQLVNNSGQTALQWACSNNVTAAIQLLLQNCPPLVNHPSNHRNLEMLQWQMQDSFHHFNMFAPVVILWLKRNKECLQLLFEAGYKATSEERTFLEMATRKDKKKVDGIIKYMIQHEFSNPSSLHRIARTVIRETLGSGLEEKAAVLPIPQALQESVCFINV